jgi:tRNA/tmRNA/rRNA uracil-C5-methylase (TrmA/RlmC/RlmD family)
VDPGDQLVLTIEKPAHGGWMIARHDGRVILVRGAVPGERVGVRVDRVEARLAFAETVEVLDGSPDRRPSLPDPRCGGCLLSHIAYARQLLVKGEVVADAFARLGHIRLDEAVPIAASPERGYRMRARLHVRQGRAGFYREGTHEICDAAATGQLTAESVNAVDAALASLGSRRSEAVAVELTENIQGDMRVAAIELGRVPADPLKVDIDLDRARRESGLTGCTLRWPGGGPLVAGVPVVEDSLPSLTGGRATAGVLSRHAESFFQANRFLVADLVSAVLDTVPEAGDVLDLYAGVGLFAVSLAAVGRTGLTAVEGDRTSGADLRRNAGAFGSAIRVVVRSVEDYLGSARRAVPATVLVDPPRTGLSREALAALVRAGPGTIAYISCDPATMARDARRLLDAGYRLASLRGFDLFPNTPHVEVLGGFTRSAVPPPR